MSMLNFTWINILFALLGAFIIYLYLNRESRSGISKSSFDLKSKKRKIIKEKKIKKLINTQLKKQDNYPISIIFESNLDDDEKIMIEKYLKGLGFTDINIGLSIVSIEK